MKRVCSKCRKVLEPIPIELNNPEIVSYGLCLRCAERFHFEAPPEFLETLKVPAYTINEKMIIQSVNNLGCALLKKRAADIKGKRHGEVFGCLNASEGALCGEIPNCTGCHIKNAVMATFLTGKGTARETAYRDGNFDLSVGDRLLEINTAKVGNLVLLCINFRNSNEDRETQA